MQIIFLGTGTSHGIPVIGCECPVCQSSSPENKRTRSSIWIEHKGVNMLIDTANEFRLQAIKAGIKNVDGVVYTHCHADHVFGFDDLRIFSQRTGKSIPVYGNQWTIEELCQVFGYAFRETQRGGGKPKVKVNVVSKPFSVSGVEVVPIPIFHGILPIYGYRIGKMAYVTDCSFIPDESLPLLEGLDLLILGVIRHQPHATHMNVTQAVELVQTVKPKKTYFTHISHHLEHHELNSELPPSIRVAYDGLEIQV